MLPNLLIIGAQKSGTTWLHANLAKHPDVFMSQPKELHYFDTGRSFDSGSAAYAAYFDQAGTAKVAGESTPNYFWCSPEHPEWFGVGGNRDFLSSQPSQIREMLGRDLVLALILRDPVERAISAYCHHLKYSGRIDLSQDFFFNARNYGIVHMGFYGAHLHHYLKHFDRDSFFIITAERMFADPRGCYIEILERLSLPTDFLPADLERPLHQNNKKMAGNESFLYTPEGSGESLTVIRREQLEELRLVYTDDIARLTSLYALDISPWTLALGGNSALPG